MKEDPPAGYKCRDKFLVQSVAITADKEYNNVQQIVRFLPNITSDGESTSNAIASGLLLKSMRSLPSRKKRYVLCFLTQARNQLRPRSMAMMNP